jgi:hypothetical protein
LTKSSIHGKIRYKQKHKTSLERRKKKMAKTKKIDPKVTFKGNVMSIVADALIAKGLVVESGDDYGFTTGTIVVKGDTYDLQLKPITPKAGVERYELAE